LKYNYDFNDKKKEKKKKLIFVIVAFTLALIIASFLFRNSEVFIIKAISNVITSPFKFIGDSASGSISSISKYFGNIDEVKTENLE
jgi:cell shape-determining protein MreC